MQIITNILLVTLLLTAAACLGRRFYRLVRGENTATCGCGTSHSCPLSPNSLSRHPDQPSTSSDCCAPRDGRRPGTLS